MVALGVSWSWVIVIVGAAVGVALALLAIAADLPSVLLTVLSALGGATVITAGVMLLTSQLETADFTLESATERINDDWWWYVTYAALAIVGIVVQVRHTERLTQTLRASWAESGGHELRHA